MLSPFAENPGPAMDAMPWHDGDPLPVVLLRYGPVAPAEYSALTDDSRFEVFSARDITPEWASFSERVAGTFVVTEADPLSALVYALTAGVRSPVVVIVAKATALEIEDALAAGAMDCLTLPLSTDCIERVVRELESVTRLGRIDATLRLLLDPVGRTARYRDKSVSLTQREYALLHCLSTYRGRPVAADKLVAYVWARNEVDQRASQIVQFHVYQLRRKLGRLGLHNAITTVRGFGYALTLSQQEFVPKSASPSGSVAVR